MGSAFERHVWLTGILVQTSILPYITLMSALLRSFEASRVTAVSSYPNDTFGH